MGKNWAICIGVNQYDNLPELKYARRDAELMRDYFLAEAGFEKVYLFTDNSPPIHDTGKPFSSQPIGNRLRRFLRTRFNTPFMSAGDNFWFFFSGHGLRHADRDYLMPSDADPHPDGVEETAISLNWVTERLRRCGADNVVLLLDACRDEQSSKGLGIGPENQKGAIAIASCSPAERSYEIDEIGQGAFTYALLEALRIQGEGNCATVERLYQRLQYRVAEINQRFRKPRQTPYAIAEPASKYHLILLPRQATLGDIDRLKKEALTAEVDGELNTAEALTIRVLAISPADPEALKAYKRIVRKSWGQSKLFQQPRNQFAGSKGQKSASPSGVETGISKIGSSRSNLRKLKWVSLATILLPAIGLLITRIPEAISLLSQIGVPPEIDRQSQEAPHSQSIDYTPLEYLLTEKRWKEAHEITTRLMLQIGDANGDESLAIEEITKFSCSKLNKINQLWLDNSNRHFGFSIQNDIYRGWDNTEDWNHFSELVGWRVGEKLLSNDKLTFSLNSSREGHLPIIQDSHGEIDRGSVVALLSRFETCNLNPTSENLETQPPPDSSGEDSNTEPPSDSDSTPSEQPSGNEDSNTEPLPDSNSTPSEQPSGNEDSNPDTLPDSDSTPSEQPSGDENSNPDTLPDSDSTPSEQPSGNEDSNPDTLPDSDSTPSEQPSGDENSNTEPLPDSEPWVEEPSAVDFLPPIDREESE